MAKRRKTDQAKRGQEKPVGQEGELAEESLFPIKGYVLLNVFFWAFCAAEVLIIKWWLRDIQGVVFFFALLAIGFTVVSIYDCIYDRIVTRRREQQPQPSQPASESGS